MGRKCGYLALMAGIAGGAEAVVIPEHEVSPETIAEEIHDAYLRGKSHAIVVVAEGASYNADAIARHYEESQSQRGFEVRVTKLGHVQRGGVPDAFDRLLGSSLGAGAVEALARGEHGVLVGMVAGEVTTIPYEEIMGVTKPLPARHIKLANILAR